MTMPAAIKEAWVRALRSGKYTQGDGLLRSKDNEYCCLGVLCDVVQREFDYDLGWVSGSPNEGYWAQYGSSDRGGSDYLVLPLTLVDALGLSKSAPNVPAALLTEEELREIGVLQKPLDLGISVAVLNDHKLSFERIADLIEETDL